MIKKYCAKQLALIVFMASVLVGCSGVNVKITYVDVELDTREGDNVIQPDETKIDSITDFDAEGELDTTVTP